MIGRTRVCSDEFVTYFKAIVYKRQLQIAILSRVPLVHDGVAVPSIYSSAPHLRLARALSSLTLQFSPLTLDGRRSFLPPTFILLAMTYTPEPMKLSQPIFRETGPLLVATRTLRRVLFP